MAEKAKNDDKLRALAEQKSVRFNREAIRALANSEIRWFALCVTPLKELYVQCRLGKRGYAVFVPLQRKYRGVNRYTKRKIRIAYALIPGYVIIGLPRKFAQWGDLLRDHNVKGMVGEGDRPLSIPREALAEFVSGVQNVMPPAAEEHMPSGKEFSVGDQCEVIDGPLEGHVVDVKSIRGRKAQILMELLNRPQLVEIPLAKLAKAS